MSINSLYTKAKRASKIISSYCKGSVYGIRPGYIHKKETQHFDDTHNADEWQKEVYATALDVFNSESYTTVLDIGCGSAYKLRSFFKDHNYTGVEIGATLDYLKSTYPTDPWCTINDCYGKTYDLIILSDVIEHVPDPAFFLQDIISNIHFHKIIISTPDRALLEGSDLGPAKNPTHYREWNQAEFSLFISSLLRVDKQIISNLEQATQLIIASPKS